MTKIKIAILAIGLLALAGCGNKAADNQAPKNEPEVKKTETSSQGGGVINSIKDAMGLGQTMKCSYTETIEGKKFVSEAYIKGEKYKAVNSEDGKKMTSLFDGTTVYSWTEGEKTGTKMEMKCLEDLSKPAENSPGDSNVPPIKETKPEEEFENATDEKCEPASEVDFNPPADVNFADQCAAMREMMNQFKNVEMPTGNLPPGMPANLPTGAPQM